MGRRKIPRHIDAPSLELDEPAMRDLLAQTTDLLVEHVASLPEQPTFAVAGGKKLARELHEPLPERGAPVKRLLKTLFGKVIPRSLNTASPGYLAYVPGGGLFQSAVADLIALATNRYTGIWMAAPALVQIEKNVLEWLCAITGLPPGAGGLLTSGGSMATMIALVAARRAHLGDDLSKGIVYTSDQAHHSVLKAALFGGIPEDHVRALPTDETFRLQTAALEQAISRDAAAGLHPFLVVSSAGTTNTGAVDDLPAISRVARAHHLWHHVDAAYGGFFAMTDRGRRALEGLEEADSITLDPHKGLFLPYGTGSLLVRDPGALRRAFAVQASYMPDAATEDGEVDFADLGPELSREARGLRVWLPLKMHGAAAFRRVLDEKLDLAAHAAREIAALPGIEIVTAPQLSLFAFRCAPAPDDPDTDRRTRALLQHINDRQRVFLSGARAKGRFFIRVCILSFRTHKDRIDALIEDVRAAAHAVTPSLPAP